MQTAFTALLMTIALVSAVGANEAFHPSEVVACMKSPEARGLTALTGNNPFYLRGDFNGDGKPDYALFVRSKVGGTGVLVCSGDGRVYVLGKGIGNTTFSDMPDDNFLAPQWAVYTKAEVKALSAFRSNVPHPVPVAKAESIAMIWEDGISLLYWDGTRFRWAGSAR